MTTYSHHGIEIHADPTPEEEAELDFYVTVADAGRVGILLGPYATHEVAKTQVDRARDFAERADPWACFYAFGTSSLPKNTPARTVFGM
jgi:hypothetical protein